MTDQSGTVELHAPAPWRDALAGALRTAGLVAATHCDDPDVPVVAAFRGGPSVAASDEWLRQSRPHLLLCVLPDRVEVGPFVEPGLTACLRCVATEAPRPGGAWHHADATGPASLVTVAAGWVAHDLCRWQSGRLPSTWSATVRLDPGPAVSRHPWLRHPHCGCSWGLPADDLTG